VSAWDAFPERKTIPKYAVIKMKLRLPGCPGQAQLTAGGSNESGGGVVRNVCGKTVEEEVNFPAGLLKKIEIST
jgi:hypothetical protein